MTEIKRVELQPLQNAGNKANTGATGATAQTSQQIIADLGTIFSIAPDPANPTAYADSYWFLPLGAQNLATHFESEFTLWVPKDAKPQAIEFEVQQQIAALIFNGALQLDYADGQLRRFKFGLPGQGSWIGFQPFVPLAPGSWHRLKAVWDRTSDLQIRHTSFLVDGVEQLAAPILTPAFREPDANVPKYPDKLNFAFQLDMSPANPFAVVVSNWTVRYA